MPTTIQKDGITWRFPANLAVGAYVCGDPAVQVAQGETEEIDQILPAVIVPSGGGRVQHGSELNLQLRNAYQQPGGSGNAEAFFQGLDGVDGGGRVYKAELNVALRVGDAMNPLEMAPGDSLISVESSNSTDANWSTVLRAAVLTATTTLPAANEFRPPYWGPQKPAQPYYWSDEALERLPRIPGLNQFVAGGWWDGNQGMVGLTAQWRALNLIIGHGEGHWRLMPTALCQSYYVERMKSLNWAFLALCADIPPAQKRELAQALVQQGIDYFWAAKNGWYAGNTHSTGRYPLIVFAALMLNHPDFDDVLSAARDDLQSFKDGLPLTPGVVWGEIGQPFHVAVTNEDPVEVNWGNGGYTEADVGDADWGNVHTTLQGQNDLQDWNVGLETAVNKNNQYRRCCAASGWVGIYLAMTAMGGLRLWGHRAFFDYTRRWIERAPSLLTAEPMHSALLSTWSALAPQSMGTRVDAPMQQIGLVPPGQARLTVEIAPTTAAPGRVRITGLPAGSQLLGAIVRAEQMALRPVRWLIDQPTTGLIYLDQSVPFTTHEWFTVLGTGEIPLALPGGEEAGNRYVLQAVVLYNGEFIPTNAVEILVRATP